MMASSVPSEMGGNENGSKNSKIQPTIRGPEIHKKVTSFKKNLQIGTNSSKLTWNELIEYSNLIFSRLRVLKNKLEEEIGIEGLSFVQVLDFLLKQNYKLNISSKNSILKNYKTFNQAIEEKRNEIEKLYSTKNPKPAPSKNKKVPPIKKSCAPRDFLGMRGALNCELKLTFDAKRLRREAQEAFDDQKYELVISKYEKLLNIYSELGKNKEISDIKKMIREIKKCT